MTQQSYCGINCKSKIEVRISRDEISRNDYNFSENTFSKREMILKQKSAITAIQ